MKKLLVVVDMQNDFIDGSLGTKEAQGIIKNVCEKIKSFDGDIVKTIDTHFNNYLDTQEGKNLPVLHCINKTEGWQINKDVQNALDETKKDIKTFEKINSFGSSELAFYISKQKYDEAEFIGLCTDICVLTNALLTRAISTETRIIVDSSCCAGVTPVSHNNALETMKVCQIKII